MAGKWLSPDFRFGSAGKHKIMELVVLYSRTNACPYLATSFFHYRPLIQDSIEATTILTQGAIDKASSMQLATLNMAWCCGLDPHRIRWKARSQLGYSTATKLDRGERQPSLTVPCLNALAGHAWNLYSVSINLRGIFHEPEFGNWPAN